MVVMLLTILFRLNESRGEPMESELRDRELVRAAKQTEKGPQADENRRTSGRELEDKRTRTGGHADENRRTSGREPEDERTRT